MKAGRKLAGRFRIGELLGRGEMGEVYAAQDVDGSHVAIKLLHDRWNDVPDVVTRFQREAENASKISSPFVAQVLAAGPHAGRLWIAYERCFGETLEARLHRERVLPAVVAQTVIEHVLLGLRAAHGAGVLHRDIKPSNVFLERSSEVPGVRALLLDFGVSKYRPTDDSTKPHTLTSVAQMLGTVRYAAPEQMISAAQVDERSDLYSAAVLAFRVLSGAMPFGGTSNGAVLHAKLNEAPRTLARVTGVPWPKDVEAFFARGLARQVDDRFDSVDAMLLAWQARMMERRLPAPNQFDKEIMRQHDPDGSVEEGEESDASSTLQG